MKARVSWLQTWMYEVRPSPRIAYLVSAKLGSREIISWCTRRSRGGRADGRVIEWSRTILGISEVDTQNPLVHEFAVLLAFLRYKLTVVGLGIRRMDVWKHTTSVYKLTIIGRYLAIAALTEEARKHSNLLLSEQDWLSGRAAVSTYPDRS